MNENEEQPPEIQVDEEKVEKLRQSLEKANFMGTKVELLKYQNFWCRSHGLKFVLHYQAHFQARDFDIILASLPKTGTTWLKSLLFSIVNRQNPDHQPLNKKSPLLTHNPHELVYHLEHVYHGDLGGNPLFPSPQKLHELASPRLLQTHIPYASQPESIKTSSTCKIVYIARNPLDTFVSQWHWHVNLMKTATTGDLEFQPPTIQHFFDDFCQGKFPYGPYFDHVLGFWKQSLEQPNKVLFLKYEDLKGDHAVVHLKKLAQFVGLPFSQQEVSEGVIDDIFQLCSISNLKKLEVNKTGFINKFVEKKNYFRKGEVGDWTNYFTPSMVDKINILMQEKLGGTGLSFKMLTHS